MRNDVAASTRDGNDDDAVADSIQSKYQNQQQQRQQYHPGQAPLMISNLLSSPKKRINKQINVLLYTRTQSNKQGETDENLFFFFFF